MAALALLATLVAGAVYCRHLGYPDGRVFTPVSAAAPRQDGTVAIFFSGDMGFNAGMGPVIAGHIAQRGVPVIGVNSLAAFARRRSPEESAALVEQAARRALALPGARRLVLAGQSFGANMLLAGLERLPPALRARVAMVALIVPADTMSFRATPGGVFDFGNDGPAAPAAHALDWAPVLCVHGVSESGSLCPGWRQPNVRVVALPGGHFLEDDSALVAKTLLRALPPPPPNIAKNSDGAEPPAI
ncbi:virulence factor family protein [Sphingobium chlorophenolicum L-1]|uniref:Virulence factor family protein n=1 Tax=Sphingobium chlorophenolicum L-1 TaxID=690566 RepID=F6EYT9_SPHCR|nr:AcvB/VirJ family lysyl-phosphatidylglycerol hydrolase [Sphingobium chlorophenolicum]AEG50139.1 virulence factor family protein [Sphingobium chlorophenolicum L-1]